MQYLRSDLNVGLILLLLAQRRSATASGVRRSIVGAGPVIPGGTLIGSSDYVDLLVQRFQARGLSSSQAKSAAHCVQDGLTKAGFKTQADAGGSNEKQSLQVILPCIQKARKP
jgi:hypothetical protein